MSWMVMFSQVLLPLSLLGWVVFYPAAGWLAWGIQLMSVTAFLLGIGLSALWVMPPFWVPYAYGLALVLVVGGHLRAGRLSFRGIWKTPAWNAVLVTLVVGLGLFGGYLSLQSAKGRVLPEGEVVHIAAPFGPGHYLVAHGGGTQTVNVHLKTLDSSVKRFLPWRGQSKALDIFRITPLGFHKHGWRPATLSRYT